MMSFADYEEQVLRDAREAIAEGAGWYGSWEEMADALFLDDSVTGNASGSYTFDAAAALENVRGLMGDERFAAEARGVGYGPGLLALDPEALDVIARCLALGRVLGELAEAYEEARAEEEEEEESE